VVWLARRRAWLWLAGLAVLVPGVLLLFGVYAARGTYVSFRYFDPADLGVRLAAVFGASWLALAALRRLAGPEAAAGREAPAGREAAAGREAPARPEAATAAPDQRPRADAAGPAGRRAGGWRGSAAAVVATVLLVAAAGWPPAPVDPLVRSTLDRDTRLSANAAAAVRELRPLAGRPGSVVVVSGPQRVRAAVELGLPLGRVRDLYLAALDAPLKDALAGSSAVFHDADGDRPAERFAPLSVTAPARIGTLWVVPVRTDPGRGLYVLAVEDG
jgi:hypothetical protein